MLPFRANGFFLASVSCVKVFRSTFRAMSFQDMHHNYGGISESHACKDGV